jgi:hypothetical protein
MNGCGRIFCEAKNRAYNSGGAILPAKLRELSAQRLLCKRAYLSPPAAARRQLRTRPYKLPQGNLYAYNSGGAILPAKLRELSAQRLLCKRAYLSPPAAARRKFP